MSESWRPTSHQVDTKAKAILADSLPPEWSAVEQSPDYAVDFRVEVFENEQKTGNFFGIQLKGSGTLDPHKATWKYSLKTKHLKAFIETERQPIFLALVDINSRQVRLIFLQKYIREVLKDANWEAQKTVTLNLGMENIISNSQEWKVLVEQSLEYVRELWPGGLQATIEHEQQKFEALDPRFRVRLTATDEKRHYLLEPKEEVNVKFQFTLKENHERLEDLVERGVPAEFQAGEIAISGSELLKRFEGGAIIEPNSAQNGTLSFFSMVEENEERILLVMPATLRLGRSGGRLTAQLPNGPFGLRADLHTNAIEPLNFVFKLPFKNWCGQRLIQLAYFSEFRQFIISASQPNSKLGVRFESPGQTNLRFISPPGHFTKLAEFLDIVEPLHHARYIATKFSINPKLEDRHFGSDWNDLTELYGYLSQPRLSQPAPGISFSATIPNLEAVKFAELAKTNPQGEHFKIESTWAFWFFDRHLVLRVSREMTHMVFTYECEKDHSLTVESEEIRGLFQGGATTSQIISVDPNTISFDFDMRT